MKTEVSTVTTKGQLVIPAKLRRKYAIRKGTQVAFVEEKNRLVLQPRFCAKNAAASGNCEASSARRQRRNDLL
jgi:AbrB family looped-hinge helix DNA binding protein